MCGIAGVVALGSRNLSTDMLKSMCDVIAHRGPDDAGYLLAQSGRMHPRHACYDECFTDREFRHVNPMLPEIDTAHGKNALNSHSWDIFFGHRRLSILDITAAGHQPMTDLTRSVWTVYNGEIYNFKELRAELIKKGYEFKTQSDTEVLIASYLEWGIDCVKKFNGMFAFALWDKRNNRFHLVRDRYGIKPVYYKRLESGEFVFGSEAKAILAYCNKQRSKVDYEALLEYFTFQNIFTDKTFYSGIKILEPGTILTADLSQKEPSIHYQKYWDFDFSQPEKMADEREYLEELERLFVQAVKRQMISDVEIGSYLSGGMDSGSITAIAAKEVPYLKSFTVGFDLTNVSAIEAGFDERKKSELMSYIYKTEHYEMVLKSGDMERCLPEYAWHMETPRVGQSYPNYYAAKLASKFVKVVLSGAGGDELFAGYPWRYYRAVNNKSFDDYIDKYYLFWQRLVDNRDLKRIFKPIWNQVDHVWTRDIFKNVFRDNPHTPITAEDYVNQSLYFEAKTFLHGLLIVEDRLSMAHSLETRVPFLDNDLVDFAMKVPVNMKLGNLTAVSRIDENDFGSKADKYFKKTKDGKLILRKALKKYMPNEISNAVKQGFSSPDQTWFRNESNNFVERELGDRENPIYNLLDYDSVNSLLKEHMSARKNRRLFVWGLLNMSYWCRQHDQLIPLKVDEYAPH
jgi:asparagine synthase (glutamine-hydrolysing)